MTDALRAAAPWLLMVAVFVGPAGIGGSTGLAGGSSTCSISCPCDAAEAEDYGSDHADATLDAGDPCEDECPDDCPSCGCCRGIAMAVLPVPVTSGTPITCTSVRRILAPLDAPASGPCTGVFRPPRSLT